MSKQIRIGNLTNGLLLNETPALDSSASLHSLVIDQTTGEVKYGIVPGTGSVSWGPITGTLSDQSDLNSALLLKANIAGPTFTGTVSGITNTMVGLGNVENTKLSTWIGSTNLTTLGTITSGTWHGSSIDSAYLTIPYQIPNSLSIGVLKYNGTTPLDGAFDGSTTAPTLTTRLNYQGKFYATALYAGVRTVLDSTLTSSPYVFNTNSTIPSGNTLFSFSNNASLVLDYKVGSGLHINNSYYLPLTDGTNGQYINTNGSGVTSWTSLPALTVGSSSVGYIKYNGTTSSAGQFDGGSTLPTAYTSLNYNGNLTVNQFNASLISVGGYYSLPTASPSGGKIIMGSGTSGSVWSPYELPTSSPTSDGTLLLSSGSNFVFGSIGNGLSVSGGNTIELGGNLTKDVEFYLLGHKFSIYGINSTYNPIYIEPSDMSFHCTDIYASGLTLTGDIAMDAVIYFTNSTDADDLIFKNPMTPAIYIDGIQGQPCYRDTNGTLYKFNLTPL